MFSVLAYFILFITCQSEYVSSKFALENDKNVTCTYLGTKYQCNCAYADEITGISPLVGSVFQIEVMNCIRLMIPTNFVYYTKGLRLVTFTNINHLVLNENALFFRDSSSSSGLVIEFKNVFIENIHSNAINGQVEQVSMVSSRVGTIYPFAFSSLMNAAYSINFSHVNISRIQSQAFKKIKVEKIEFFNTNFDTALPSKTFYDVHVTNSFKIENSTFTTIHSKGIHMNASNFMFDNNRVDKLNGEAFEILIGKRVFMRNNKFGIISSAAFKEISPSKEYMLAKHNKMDFIFANNTLQIEETLPPFVINSNFHFMPKTIYFLNNISCDQCKILQENSFYSLHSDAFYFRLSGEDHFKVFTSIVNEDCIEKSQKFLIAIIVGSLIIISILIALVVYFVIKRKRKRKLDIVTPEPRTYRETQIIFQIENAGLLKTDL